MKYAHKIIDTTYFDVKALTPGESWMLEVPEEARDLVRPTFSIFEDLEGTCGIATAVTGTLK